MSCKEILYLILVLCVGGIGILFIYLAIAGAMDTSFDNKDRMYCNSAKVSGNEEYLVKCECFYNGNDIRCIYEGK